MPTKTEMKQKAQRNLLLAMQTAFGDCYDMTEEETAIASEQFARVEKLFGYEQYSFGRMV